MNLTIVELTKLWKEKGFKVLSNLDQNSINAVEINMKLLENIIETNKNSEYGKKHNFSEIDDVHSFKQNVPFTTYEDYEDDVIRMMEGEKDILTSSPVVFYADTSGTTGKIKKVPVSKKGLEIFQDYAASAMPAVISEFFSTTRGHDTPDGKRIMLLHFKKEALSSGAYFGCISAASLNEKSIAIMKNFVTTPYDAMACPQSADFNYLHALYALSSRDVVYLSSSYMSVILDFAYYISDNWQMLVKDIKDGKINDSVTMPEWLRDKLQKDLRPNPDRASELNAEFSKGLDNKIFKRIWPNLSAVCAIWAGSFNSFAWEMQKFTGRSIPYYTMAYTMSEGAVGLARHPFDQSYVLLTDSCFFEFSKNIFDDNDIDRSDTLLIDEVKVGESYELIVTNQSGFYRYKTGDVIKIVGFYHEAPLIEFQFRKKNILSLVGEIFTEEHLKDAMNTFEEKSGVEFTDYCIYPNRMSKPPRYEIYAEPKGQILLKKIEQYEKLLHEELYKACSDFKDYNIGQTKLRILQKDAFKDFREYRIKSQNISATQIKPIRVIDNKNTFDYFTTKEVQD